MPFNYNKLWKLLILNYINAIMNESYIETFLKTDRLPFLDLEGDMEPNQQAVDEVLRYIDDNSQLHAKVSLKSIKDKFMRAPYGYVDDDVEWLVAKLFNDSKITLYTAGCSLNKFNDSIDDIIRDITKKEFVDKLLIERRETPPQTQIKAVKEILKELFDVSSAKDDVAALMNEFIRYCNDLIKDFEHLEVFYQSHAYPGKYTIQNGKVLLRKISLIQNTKDFFEEVLKLQNDLLSLAEDYEPIKGFFKGEQKGIFDESLKLMDVYDKSKTFIVNQQIEDTASKIKVILKVKSPYNEIFKLPELNEKFRNIYVELLEEMSIPVIKAIDEAKESVLTKIMDKSYIEEFELRYFLLFKKLYEKAHSTNNVADLQTIKVEADALKIRLINEMNTKDEEIRNQGYGVEDPEEGGEAPKPEGQMPPVKAKRRKSVSIKQMTTASSWQIENPEDVDHYLQTLKEKILSQIDEDTVVDIVF